MAAGKILIVDDKPENVAILYKLLQHHGYSVLVATDGDSGLAVARGQKPDLILLDVMMPGMDGFTVCRNLKADSNTREIPVIFMTALSEIDKKLQAFKAGGVDYIVKPLEQEEVRARIETHLTIYRLQQALRDKNQDLELKNAQLDAFSHTVAHDLKNPLNTIVGSVDLALFACEDDDIDEIKTGLKIIGRTAAKAGDIIESLLLLADTSRHAQVCIEPFDMGYIVPKALERLAFMIDEYHATVRVPDAWPQASGHTAWVEEVWVNYISNALKYGGNPPRVELGAEIQDDGFICFWVRDNGPGLNQEQQRKLFVPFNRLHTERADGHGLGLSIVQNIMTRLGGKAGVESAQGRGCRFYFTLPRQSPPESATAQPETRDHSHD